MNAMIHFPSQGGHLFAFLPEVGEVLEGPPFHLFPFSALSRSCDHFTHSPATKQCRPHEPRRFLTSMTIPAHWAPDLEGGGLWEICRLSWLSQDELRSHRIPGDLPECPSREPEPALRKSLLHLQHYLLRRCCIWRKCQAKSGLGIGLLRQSPALWVVEDFCKAALPCFYLGVELPIASKISFLRAPILTIKLV